MEDNQRKGPGIFYGVIGVCTLIVAIIGATFAYFTATAEDKTTIQGKAADTGLSLEVTHLSTDATAGLVPLLTTDLEKALLGDVATSEKACVDMNGNSVCQVYSIKVTNEGDTAVTIAGKLNLIPVNTEEGVEPAITSTFSNLKWRLLNSQTEVKADGTVNATGVSNIVESVTVEAEASQTYYIAVWIDENNNKQDDSDKGYFNGTVTFNSASGSGITATFTA